MVWDHRKYNSIDFQFKKEFGKKMIKLSIDGGFNCPNRINGSGCIFCSEMGSGEFAGENHEFLGKRTISQSITSQIDSQIKLLSTKWKTDKTSNISYIAYFQSFTSTYADLDYLKKVYFEALSHPLVEGIAIATRPDSISDEAMELIVEISKSHLIWIELGIQTFNEKTADYLNRGYDNSIFFNTYNILKNNDIRIVLHLIAGLPHEDNNEFMKTIRWINCLEPWGIKIHMLNILKNTKLEKLHNQDPLNLLTSEEYITLVCDALELLSPNVTIHRLTGDGPKSLLIEPQWIRDKKRILNGIDKEMSRRNSFQGKHYT